MSDINLNTPIGDIDFGDYDMPSGVNTLGDFVNLHKTVSKDKVKYESKVRNPTPAEALSDDKLMENPAIREFILNSPDHEAVKESFRQSGVSQAQYEQLVGHFYGAQVQNIQGQEQAIGEWENEVAGYYGENFDTAMKIYEDATGHSPIGLSIEAIENVLIQQVGYADDAALNPNNGQLATNEAGELQDPVWSIDFNGQPQYIDPTDIKKIAEFGQRTIDVNGKKVPLINHSREARKLHEKAKTFYQQNYAAIQAQKASNSYAE